MSVLSRRKIAAVALKADGRPEVLEDAPWMTETLRTALDLQSFSAGDLAERLQISPQAANSRLKSLTASGAVVRVRVIPEGGGKEFSYRAAIPTSPTRGLAPATKSRIRGTSQRAMSEQHDHGPGRRKAPDARGGPNWSMP